MYRSGQQDCKKIVIFSDPLTAEAARYLLTFEEAREVLTAFLETKKSLDEACAKIESVRLEIDEAQRNIHRDGAEVARTLMRAAEAVDWDDHFRRLGMEVHANGYAALQALVTDGLKDSQDRIARVIANFNSDLDARISNLEAAVVGKPVLPVIPPDATDLQRLRLSVRIAIARLRRWSIDVTPPATLASIILLNLALFMEIGLLVRLRLLN